MNDTQVIEDEAEKAEIQAELRVPLLEQSERDVDEYKINLTYNELDHLRKRFLKYCVICDSVKPPRTHHCR